MPHGHEEAGKAVAPEEAVVAAMPEEAAMWHEEVVQAVAPEEAIMAATPEEAAGAAMAWSSDGDDLPWAGAGVARDWLGHHDWGMSRRAGEDVVAGGT